MTVSSPSTNKEDPDADVNLSRQYGEGNDDVYTLALVNTSMVLWLPGASVRITGVAPLLNTWVHVAATWDGAVVQLFINGTVIFTAPYSQQLPTTTNPVLLGNNANQSGLNQAVAGLLDEVRFYNRALSEAEILTLATPPGP